MEKKGAYKNCVDWLVPFPMGIFVEPSNAQTCNLKLPHTSFQWWRYTFIRRLNRMHLADGGKRKKRTRKMRLWLPGTSPNRKPTACCTMKSWLKQTAQLQWQCLCDSLFLLLEKNNCHSTTTASYPFNRCLQSTVRSTVRDSTACSWFWPKDVGALLNTGQYGHW